MNRLLAAHYTAGQLNRAIRNDFVRVHVGLGARSRLPDTQWKMCIEFSFDDFIAGLHNYFSFVSGQFAEILVYQGGAFFENAQGANHFARHDVVTDVEMMKTPLSLRPPIFISGYIDFTHRISFEAKLAFRLSFFRRHKCGNPKQLKLMEKSTRIVQRW